MYGAVNTSFTSHVKTHYGLFFLHMQSPLASTQNITNEDN